MLRLKNYPVEHNCPDCHLGNLQFEGHDTEQLDDGMFQTYATWICDYCGCGKSYHYGEPFEQAEQDEREDGNA